MRAKIICLFTLLFVGGAIFLPKTSAQEDALRIEPRSGRYSLEVPASWITTQDEVRGLSGTFADEIIAIADSEEAMRALQSNDRTRPIVGQTLIANVFPTIAATRGQSISDPSAIFEVILQQDAAVATYFELNGLAAVRVDTYTGPPYENAEFAGLTMILNGNLIYYIVYGAPTLAEFEALQVLATTLEVNPVASNLIDPTTLGNRAPFQVGNLDVPMIAGWMVLTSGPPVPGIPQMFMIVPEPAQTVDSLIIPAFDTDAVPGLFIQVQSHPYDTRFGTADYTPTDDDRSQLLGETLAATGGEPVLGTQVFEMNQQPALLLDVENVFGGANVGRILLIDGQDTLYTLTLVGPAARWETDYAPLVDAIIAGVAVEPPIVAIEGEVQEGIQVGQRAPDFTLLTLEGESVSLSDFRGKVVLLNFWATWCPPCRVEMPEFELIYTDRDDFEVLAVNLIESNSQVQDFVDELGLTFTIAMDSDGSINNLYEVVGYPTTLIINPEGIVEVVYAGAVTAAQVANWVELAAE